ncbi:MAG: thioredoxin-dependent thiol peroxidase [Gloeomargaritaceae cyanobacterium C42_A2020_066]|nr:thioredoxin-dependent thiol peroxidase [Gloeomargaritaceae cyanobacterium C42_A2020_066]
MALQVGDLAPDFSLLDSDDQRVSLQDLRGGWVVLYFYPKDLTPGCTKEACGFRDRYSDFTGRKGEILGISPDSPETHRRFRAKHGLPFRLLSDADSQVAMAYGSYGPKQFMGKSYVGVYRQTFVIDPDGRIGRIYRKVKPEGHALEVLTDWADLVQG